MSHDMDEIKNLKDVIRSLSHRVSTLEEEILTMRMSKQLNIQTHTNYSDRAEEKINKLIILGYEKDKCLCGLQITKTDKQIPIIELNMYNLNNFISKMGRALQIGDDRVILGDYKQHAKYAVLNRGEWKIAH